MAFIRKQISKENARMRLENMCARSEHCEWELKEKLKGWMISPSDAEEILSALRKARFYDDRRFASAYVRDKMMYNRWGRRKIAYGLRGKRIAREFIDEALDAVDEQAYREILLDFLRSKARAIKEGNTFEGRTRLFRAAASRGYETELVAKYIRSAVIWPDEVAEDES